jgi:hypothetical protein
LKSFGDVYGVSVILTMPLKVYVQYFLIADYLIYVVPGICAAPGELDPVNVFQHIFRERHPSGDYTIGTGLRDGR